MIPIPILTFIFLIDFLIPLIIIYHSQHLFLIFNLFFFFDETYC